MSEREFAYQTSDELCRQMAEHCSGTCLLAFSTGKDAIAAWLQLRKHFTRIIPFYLFTVPGLSFVEKSLEYYENWFGQEIIRLPHPSFARMIDNLVFQPPNRITRIEKLNLSKFSYLDISNTIWDMMSLPDKPYVANGVRSVDSPYRWAANKKYGAINHKERTFQAVYDYRKADILTALKDADIRLPVDYRLFGRTFDGLDARFTIPLKKHYPNDYKKLIHFFPLAELDILRYEARECHKRDAILCPE